MHSIPSVSTQTLMRIHYASRGGGMATWINFFNYLKNGAF
ncbi:hypothetical protein NP493_576g00000 [Ridgeia piscesae]|uniref:Uncharacterized protein n=1 Tax=Ridgeia piscesae TaxID=27915 RepID=A0AAD9KUY3_RIDPI|nr:hypothetical protein NP493_576g00000 [Ridgeia piscesae]